MARGKRGSGRKGNDEKKDLVRLAALWVNETADGDEYFSGYLQDAKILIFENGFKEEDNQPDYIVYLAPKPPPEDDKPRRGGRSRGRNRDEEDEGGDNGGRRGRNRKAF